MEENNNFIKNIKIRNFKSLRNDFEMKNLVDFGKINLIYGFNGNGKTTFSTALDLINNKEANFDYEINSKKNDNFKYKIIVYNNEFIKNNINFEKQIKRIYIGSENILNKSKLLNLENQKKETEDKKEKLENLIKQTKDILNVSYLNYYLKRFYNASMKQENFYNYLSYNNNERNFILTEEKENNYDDLFKEKEPTKIIKYSNFLKYFNNEYIDDINTNILSKNIINTTIEELENNNEAKNWVETGLNIYKKHNNEKCFFCGSIIKEDRILVLEKFFNKSFYEIKKDINDKKNEINLLIKNLNKEIDSIENLNKEIYFEFVQDFNYSLKKLKKSKKIYNKFLESIEKDLDFKLLNLDITNKFININIYKYIIQNLKLNINSINLIIMKNNKLIINKKKELEKAKKELMLSYCNKNNLFSNYKKYKEYETELEKENNNLTLITNEINKIKNETNNLAIKKLNEYIQAILPQFLIEEKIDTNDEKYFVLKRNGEIANSLSDGEKTIISFCYFLTLLEKNKEDKPIIVIDDPVSSLDNNFLFIIISKIKDKIKDKKIKQIFLLTHNFYFFYKIKELLIYLKNKNENIQIMEITKKQGNIIIQNNTFLENYQSEYRYIIEKINSYDNNNKEDNILFSMLIRKALEIFLDFKDNAKTLTEKFNNILQSFEDVEKDKFKPLLEMSNAIEHPENNCDGLSQNYFIFGPENIKNIKELFLNFIEEVDKEHFKAFYKK